MAPTKRKLPRQKTCIQLIRTKSLAGCYGRVTRCHLYSPAALECSTERYLVGVLEVAADRKTTRQTGDLDAHGFDHEGQVGGRRLTLGVRICCQDQLLNLARSQTQQQLTDAELVRAHALERVDRP